MSVFSKDFVSRVTVGAATVALVFQPQMMLAAGTTETVAPKTAVAPKTKSQPVERSIVVSRTTLDGVRLAQHVSAPRDVVLQDNGVLTGRVVNASGLALPNTAVSLQSGGKEVARVVSDDKGKFEAEGLKGGVYQVASTGHQGVYRLWAPRTAPPAAAQGLSIVSQPTDIVRGQYAPGPGNPFASAGQWIAEHPIITAGAVAAAIAIPIALNDDDDTTTTPATP